MRGRAKNSVRPENDCSVRLIRAGFEPFRVAAIQTSFYKCANRSCMGRARHWGQPRPRRGSKPAREDLDG